MKMILTFNLAESVAKYRVAFNKSIAESPVPVVTEQMKLEQQQVIESANVIRELTEEEYKRIDEVLKEAQKSTPY